MLGDNYTKIQFNPLTYNKARSSVMKRMLRHELSPATIHADARDINRRRRQFMPMFAA